MSPANILGTLRVVFWTRSIRNDTSTEYFLEPDCHCISLCMCVFSLARRWFIQSRLGGRVCIDILKTSFRRAK